MSDAPSQTEPSFDELLTQFGYEPPRQPQIQGDDFDSMFESLVAQTPATKADIAQFFIERSMSNADAGTFDINKDAEDFTKLFPAYRGQVDAVETSRRVNQMSKIASDLLQKTSAGIGDIARIDQWGDEVLGIIPPEDRPLLFGLMSHIARKQYEMSDEDFASRIPQAFKRGIKGIELNTRQLIEDVIGINVGTNAADARQLAQLREASDPVKGQNVLGRGFIGATRMLPSIAQSQASGGIIPGGSTAFWAAQMIPESYSDLVSRGVNENAARAISIPAGIVQGIIEQVQIEGLAAVPAASVKVFLGNLVKEYLKETVLEEGGQAAVQSLARFIGSKVDPNSKPWRMDEEARDIFDNVVGAMEVMPFLMAGGQAMQFSQIKTNAEALDMYKGLADPDKAMQFALQNYDEVLARVDSKEGLAPMFRGMELNKKDSVKVQDNIDKALSKLKTFFQGTEALDTKVLEAIEAGKNLTPEVISKIENEEPLSRADVDGILPKRNSAADREAWAAMMREQLSIESQRSGTREEAEAQMVRDATQAKKMEDNIWDAILQPTPEATIEDIDLLPRAQAEETPEAPPEQKQQYLVQQIRNIDTAIDEQFKHFVKLNPGLADPGSDFAQTPHGQYMIAERNRLAQELQGVTQQLDQQAMQERQAPEAAPLSPLDQQQEASDALQQEAQVQEQAQVPQEAPVAVPKVIRQNVTGAFPGARVTPQPNGYNVELPDGTNFNVEGATDIPINEDALREQNPDISPEEVAGYRAAAATIITTGDTETDPLTLVKIATEIEQDELVRHEGIHVARAFGLFKDSEWNALVRKHSDPSKSDAAQEEDIAKARQAWTPKTGLATRIKNFINKILSSIGMTDLDPDAVEALIESRGFWSRQTNRTRTSERYAVRRAEQLASPATDPEARALGQAIDDKMEAEGYPGTESREKVAQQAALRLKNDREGVLLELEEEAKRGGTFNSVQTAMGKQLYNDLAVEALSSDNDARLDQAINFFRGVWRQSGTVAGRALAMRFDPMETPQQRRQRAVVEGIMEPSKRIKDAINKAEASKDPGAAKRARAQHIREINRIKEALKAMGISLADLPSISQDKAKSLEVLGKIRPLKAGVSDMMFEFWNQMILSGLGTAAANTFGNLGNAAWHFAVERIVEAAIADLTRAATGKKLKGAARLGEVKYYLQGLMPGLSRGSKRAVMAWNTETDVFSSELGVGGKSKLDSPSGAIPGRFGKAVRMLGYRHLMALDVFAKSITSEMDVGAQAYRIAMDEGLSGQNLVDRMMELTNDTSSEAWAAAINTAEMLAFQEDGGALVESVNKMRRNVPGLRWLVPFVKTPANIFKRGMMKSPLGAIWLGAEVINAAKTGDWSRVPARAAEQMIAWTLLLALIGLDDEEDPRLTGTKSGGGWRRGMSDRMTGAPPPQSLRIGDTWYSYARIIEPFSTALGILVDAKDAVRSGDPMEVAISPVFSLVQQVKDKTFVKGIGDIFRFVEADTEEELVKKVAEYGVNFASSWVPNLYRSTVRAVREEDTERAVWGKGSDLWKRLAKRTAQRAELPFVEDNPKVDLWGRPVKASAPAWLGTDVLFRLGVIPVRTKEVAGAMPGDIWLINWNNLYADDPQYPIPPQRHYRVKDETFYWTDDQYTKLSTKAGEYLAEYVDAAIANGRLHPENPKQYEVNIFKNLLSSSRKRAKQEILYPAK